MKNSQSKNLKEIRKRRKKKRMTTLSPSGIRTTQKTRTPLAPSTDSTARATGPKKK